MVQRNYQREINEMLEEFRMKNEQKRKAGRRAPPSFRSIRNDYENLKRSYEENRVWQR